MKTILNLSVVAALLFAAASPCFALMMLENVSKERAKELGLEIRSNAAGSKAVRVELEFEPKGALTNYQRVDLIVGDSDQSSLRATLKEEKSKPGRIVVSIAVARADLGKITLRIVTGGGRSMVGHDIRVKDFVTLEKTGTGDTPANR